MTSRSDSPPPLVLPVQSEGCSRVVPPRRRSVQRQGRRSEGNREPHTPLSPQRPRLLEVPRRFGSPQKATLRLAMIDALSRDQFSEPTLDLRQDHQALDRILQRGIRWQLLDRLQDLLFGAVTWHWRLLGCTH